jgi:hypothetical protein
MPIPAMSIRHHGDAARTLSRVKVLSRHHRVGHYRYKNRRFDNPDDAMVAEHEPDQQALFIISGVPCPPGYNGKHGRCVPID